MAIEFDIDVENGLVHTMARGEIGPEDLRSHIERLHADPRFDASFSRLFDVRGGEFLEFDSEALRQLAIDWMATSAGGRRAILVSSEASYGLGRMFQVYSETAGHDVRIFRDIDEALAWLTQRPETTAATQK